MEEGDCRKIPVCAPNDRIGRSIYDDDCADDDDASF